MKILVIVEGTPSKETSDSIQALGLSYIVNTNPNEGYNLHEQETIDYSHAIIIPSDAVLTENYLDIINVYTQEDAVMLPLTVLKTEKLSGVLNTCLWNVNLAQQYGELDHELALKQIDLTLYGALIPSTLLKKENFKEGLKFYQHFYFLNKITKDEVAVVGVPKTLLTTSVDLTFDGANNEEKVKYFNMAKEV
jgi:hypothetical protein